MKSLVLSTALATVLFCGASRADVFIGLQEADVNGGAITQVASGANFASWSGAYGDWFNIQSISVTSIADKLASTALDILGTAARTLNVYVTSTDQTGLGALTSALTSNQLPDGGVATLSTYVDAGNGVFALTTPIGAHTFSTIGTDVDVASGAAAEPYSITGLYSLDSPGGISGLQSFLDTIKVTAQTEAVPEPGTLGILGAALLGFGLIWRRRSSQS